MPDPNPKEATPKPPFKWDSEASNTPYYPGQHEDKWEDGRPIYYRPAPTVAPVPEEWRDASNLVIDPSKPFQYGKDVIFSCSSPYDATKACDAHNAALASLIVELDNAYDTNNKNIEELAALRQDKDALDWLESNHIDMLANPLKMPMWQSSGNIRKAIAQYRAALRADKGGQE